MNDDIIVESENDVEDELIEHESEDIEWQTRILTQIDQLKECDNQLQNQMTTMQNLLETISNQMTNLSMSNKTSEEEIESELNPEKMEEIPIVEDEPQETLLIESEEIPEPKKPWSGRRRNKKR